MKEVVIGEGMDGAHTIPIIIIPATKQKVLKNLYGAFNQPDQANPGGVGNYDNYYYYLMYFHVIYSTPKVTTMPISTIHVSTVFLLSATLMIVLDIPSRFIMSSTFLCAFYERWGGRRGIIHK